MANLFRLGFSFSKNPILLNCIRSVTTTPILNLKEIQVHQKGESVVIEGVNVPSPRAELLIRAEIEPGEQQPCYMCALNLDVKHTDVLILSQFVRSDGCMLPRRITKLCSRQQKKMGKLVAMAQKAGLMINLTPHYCKKDPKLRYGHKKFNTYFDENTIFMKRIPRQEDKFKR